ncbi:MAG: TRAP transporter large permease subunit [Proteobacteria bacterium]|nr:TRAP transporter large permease subunit [Pseudomonadota bacterium]
MNLVAAPIAVLGALGMPLFALILGLAMAGFTARGINLGVVAVEFYRLSDTPVLVAIPLFTFAGYVLSEANTSTRLVRLTQAILGWLPGGLAIVSLFICALFTAFTGASGVTIVALGALLMPALVRTGYGEKFSLGLVTTSGALGLLIPPSLPLILYGIVSQQMDTGYGVTMERLFIAGIGPTLLMIGALSVYVVWMSFKHGVKLTRFSAREVRAALWAARWEMPLPFFVLGGIYGGWFAVSEAAAVTALYVLIVEVLLYREIPLKRLPGLAVESMLMVGGILIVLASAMVLTNLMIDAEVPTKLFAFVKAWIDDKYTFLLVLNIFLLILGALLDIFAALVIVVPLILPVAAGYGVDPVHLAMVFLANMQIGYLTPPVGLNLFIASYRFDKPIEQIYHATAPFIVVLLAALAVITYWPALSLFLLP